MCIEIYELDSAHFLSAPGLAWQACLKTKEVELELVTDADMLLMVEKGIRVGICQAIHRYVKANNKFMKEYNEDEEESFLQYHVINNLYEWVMIQPLPVNSFKWVGNVSKIEEDFIKSYVEDVDISYFLELVIEYPKELHDLHIDLPFLPEKMEINGQNKFACTQNDRKTMLLI